MGILKGDYIWRFLMGILNGDFEGGHCLGIV